MADNTAYSPCRLLTIPPEIRNHILGEVFFPGEKQPRSFDQDDCGLASTAVRQIHPYYTIEMDRTQSFDTAVIRTCKQLQHEGEVVLYGTSSWSLMYRDWTDYCYAPAKRGLSYEFFERLPRRLRQLIRRVDRKCYSKNYSATISLHDWTLFMTFLARECPNLQSLILWGPGDKDEAPAWVENCSKDAEWVKAILQIKTLKYFDIPVIKNGIIYSFPAFKDDFLPWIKSSLERQDRSICNGDYREPPSTPETFPFLRLPQVIRHRIYKYVMLPRTKRIHPYIKPWYDQTTRNVLPLFLSCRTIYTEASVYLYSRTIFTSPDRKYDGKLLHFLQRLQSKLHLGSQHSCLTFVKRVRLRKENVIKPALLEFAARNMQLDILQVVLAYEPNIQAINDAAEIFARFVAIEIETHGSIILHPDCRSWFAEGPKRESIFEKGYRLLLPTQRNARWEDHWSAADF